MVLRELWTLLLCSGVQSIGHLFSANRQIGSRLRAAAGALALGSCACRAQLRFLPTPGSYLWTFCCELALGALLSVIWEAVKGEKWSEGDTILLAASGWVIPAVAILACDITAELALSHRIREAQSGLIFSIASLDASGAIFVLCPGWLLYTARARP